jgi:twinkle protein
MTELLLLKLMTDTLANWNLFLFDGFGSFDPDLIYNRIEYLATGLDTKVIFLDHLSIFSVVLTVMSDG